MDMWTSPKRYLLTLDGRVVEAGPGVSGALLVAAGSQITEEKARKYGLLQPFQEGALKLGGPNGSLAIGEIPEGTILKRQGSTIVGVPAETSGFPTEIDGGLI